MPLFVAGAIAKTLGIIVAILIGVGILIGLAVGRKK